VPPAGSVVARYSQTQSIDEPLAMQRGGTASFYHADGLGSVTSLSNTAGTLVQTYTLDSFGNQTAASGSITNPFQYTAREFDGEIVLDYMRARYFDPVTGRFISEDPVAFLGGRNFYTYVGNWPTLYTDPSGLAPICKIPVPPPPDKRKLPTPITTCASDSLLDCIIQTESGGNPKAKSSKGATGLMQVTPAAIAELDRQGFDTINMTNQQLGTTFLNLLLTYCNNVSAAVAAYNAGAGAVNKAGGIPNNSETPGYVRKVNSCLEKSGLKGGLNNPGATGGCGCQ
jgi:RHS repeat-associated protein